MNKIVREHYPVDKLPEDLRELFPNAEEVTIEISVADEAREQTGAETVAMFKQLRGPPGEQNKTMGDIVRDVRLLRDEWED